MQKYCEKCGIIFDQEQKRCEECNGSLQKICECGNDIDDGGDTCEGCK